MKKFLAVLFLCAAAICAHAQTTVTGTVIDPNGNAYAFGTASAYSLTASGAPSTSTTPVATNSAGAFSMTLAANTYIFTLCAPPVQLGPLANPTPQQVCFSSQPVAISGSSLDISSLLNATAAVLGPKQKLPFLPGYSTAQYGTTGNGTTEDSLTFQAAINACPQISPIIGCDIYVPAGLYKWSSAVAIGLLKGVHIHGSGSVGTGGCSTTIQYYGTGDAFTIGDGVHPDSNGFEIDNVCVQDMLGTGGSGFHAQAIRDGTFMNDGCIGFQVGACFLLDGGSNFTQFITVLNPYVWQTKYPLQGSNPTASQFKTASIYVFGGELNCQNSTRTDVIPGSVGIDIGYSRQVASTGTGSEWSVDTQTQNCQVGIGIWDGGGNHFWGKAAEDTLVPRGSGTIGVAVTGDTASLANGNYFDGIQVTGAGTGIYLGPNTANTTISNPIFNGTNGVDYVADLGADASTSRHVTKRLTGSQANFTSISRASSIVTGVTNGADSIFAGTLGQVFGVTGGTTSFNGTFPMTCTTNDTANSSTCTWTQTGANESGTVNAGGCAGVGSCLAPLSTGETAGVGQLEITGDNTTQDITLQIPSIPNQANLPLTAPAGTTKLFPDGIATDILENNNGVVHLTDQGSNVYLGGQSQSYTPQPTTMTGGFGTVNTSGTAVTWESGNYFALGWTGQVTINNVVYPIATVNSLTSITLTATAGTQTGVNYNASGVPGIPPCSSPLGNVCTSSDDKKHIVLTNTNGSTLCLPPMNSVAYPPHFGFWAEFEPGGAVANYFSITPPGGTSLYSQSCLGTAALFRGLSTNKNLSGNQGLYIHTNGVNWFAGSGSDDVPLDQIQNAISTNAIALQAGSWTGGGSGANNGADWTETAGNSNSSGGRGGDMRRACGSDSASGKNGDCGIDQTFNAGIGLASKNGFIVRPCKDVTGTDCVNTVPSGNSGAVRLTVSGTDAAGAVGIVVSGAGAGAPAQVRISGVYGHDFTDGAVVETNCPSGQINYYASGSTNSLDNGAGECDTTDSGRRVGYAMTAATGGIGTVSTSGTAVTWVSGTQFNTSWTGTVTINNVPYTISSVGSATSMTLTATAGTQTGVGYSASGVCSHATPCKVPVLILPATQSVAVQASSITTLGSPVNISGVTAVLTKAVTMPAGGCPCRAFVSYGYYANAGAHGLIQAFVTDGSNPMATTEMNISIDGNSDGREGSSFSPVTYANGAAVTFTLDVNNSSAGTVVVAATNGGSVGQNTWMNVAIMPSN